ncbi:MAG: hypothetical protein U1C19_06260 [Methanobacteriaceae archaeon]|nr:hypothetical protein [Methanobacteriaceae archaeon]
MKEKLVSIVTFIFALLFASLLIQEIISGNALNSFFSLYGMILSTILIFKRHMGLKEIVISIILFSIGIGLILIYTHLFTPALVGSEAYKANFILLAGTFFFLHLFSRKRLDKGIDTR